MAMNFNLDPIYPLNDVIEMFTEQAETQLKVNAMTQHVFPNEIYLGFKSVNEHRKRFHQWYATGEGVKSFEGHVISADSQSGKVDVLFSYNDYLRYVDIGVGKGTKAGDVERGRNVRYKQRYSKKWDRGQGRSHRPAIMPEMNHLAQRIQRYLVDFYGHEGEMAIMKLVDRKS